MALHENGGSLDFKQLISDNEGAKHVYSRIVFTYKENNKTFKEISGIEKNNIPCKAIQAPSDKHCVRDYLKRR